MMFAQPSGVGGHPNSGGDKKKMGDVVRLTERRHARASSIVVGRETCDGQSKPSGHLSENQQITSSYLRAVNVLPSSSSRSKKRQSPAASRPTVAKLTSFDFAYADAQAMRLDRSSVSMVGNDSRKIPTAQAKSVGKFLLAKMVGKSDKSAMAAVDQIRRTLKLAMANAGDTPIALARELERGRDYIRDFLIGKKRSLDMEVIVAIADKYGLDQKELMPVKEQPETIRKGARPHLYITEHMEARGFDDKAMANRMEGIPPEAVAKWRTTEPSKLEKWQVGAILHALDLEDESALTSLPIPAKQPQPRRSAVRKRA